MSAGSEITSSNKGSVSKIKESNANNTNNSSSSASKVNKFETLNINKLYRGKSLEQSRAPVTKHGMQSIGKLGNIRRMPNPSSLSTLTKEKTAVEEQNETNNSSLKESATPSSSTLFAPSSLPSSLSLQSNSVGGGNSSSLSQTNSGASWSTQTVHTSSSNKNLTVGLESASLSKPVSITTASHVGSGNLPWTGVTSTKQQDAFPALGEEPPQRQRPDPLPYPRVNLKKPILPSSEFPELGSTIEDVTAKEQQVMMMPQKQGEQSCVSLPTQPTSNPSLASSSSDASYGPGPALRPPVLNWNQANNNNLSLPSQGINGSADAGRSFPAHSFTHVLPPSHRQTINSSSLQFPAQRSGFPGGGASTNPSLGGNQQQQDFNRGIRFVDVSFCLMNPFTI